jgi:hypothetical protein
VARGVAATCEDDELVISDYPGFVGLLGMYDRGEYTIDNH